MRTFPLAAAAVALFVAATFSAASTAASKSNVCPGGQVRFGVEPYDSGPKFVGAYQTLTKLMAQ